MRRYLQGTLDYACGMYAVINALSCLYGLDLAGARHIFQDSLLTLAAMPEHWAALVRNNTDHYWVVRYMIGRWCSRHPYKLRLEQPFSDSLLPKDGKAGMTAHGLYLPEKEAPHGPECRQKAEWEARTVWETMADWFAAPQGSRPDARKAAILRFHRFLPGMVQPVVSHWTTVCRLDKNVLHLHDASGEKGALLSLEHRDIVPGLRQRALIRIVPESLLLVTTDP